MAGDDSDQCFCYSVHVLQFFFLDLNFFHASRLGVDFLPLFCLDKF